MKKFIVSENILNKINNIIIQESFSDKVTMVKDYLDKNYMRATYEQDGKNVGIFVKLSNGLPTKKSLWKQDVLDDLDEKYYKLIKDKKERDGFLNQVLTDWYNKHKSLKNGTLSNYKW